MAWRKSYPVRFGDIDDAGIVYYPRLFEALHEAFEDFWAEALERPYPGVLHDEKVGYPAVKMETEFRKPLRYGERFAVEISVARLGNKSVTWRYRGFHDPPGALAFVEAQIVTACIDMDTFEAREIPADHRELLAPHQAETT